MSDLEIHSVQYLPFSDTEMRTEDSETKRKLVCIFARLSKVQNVFQLAAANYLGILLNTMFSILFSINYCAIIYHTMSFIMDCKLCAIVMQTSMVTPQNVELGTHSSTCVTLIKSFVMAR